MAVEGITSLVQSLADQTLAQPIDAQVKEGAPAAAAIPAVTGDTFTPSSQNKSAQATAQDAGLFQVSQGALNALAANAVFATTVPGATQNGHPGETPSSTASNPEKQSAAAANANEPSNPGQLFSSNSGTPAASAKAEPTADTQQEIQALNEALPALGLSKEEIQEIDHLATQIQNFNPGAYSNLVSQFESLAQPAAQQNASNNDASTHEIGTATTSANTKTNGSSSQE